MKPYAEKARIGWWIHTPGGRRLWTPTRRLAERELRGYEEVWAIGTEHWSSPRSGEQHGRHGHNSR